MSGAVVYVLAEIAAERQAQDEKWGEQNHPDLSPRLHRPSTEFMSSLRPGWLAQVSRYYSVPLADRARDYCEEEHKSGEGSWFSIHVEELGEALEAAADGDVASLRAELVQLAATVTAHVEAIDRRAVREERARLDRRLDDLIAQHEATVRDES